jgi:hypothetical protein
LRVVPGLERHSSPLLILASFWSSFLSVLVYTAGYDFSVAR